MYDVIEQIEATLGSKLADDDRREILSAVVSNYNEGVTDGVGDGILDAVKGFADAVRVAAGVAE